MRFLQFRPDGRTLLTAAVDGDVRFWDLLPTAATLGELNLQATLLAARTNNSSAGMTPLSRDDLRRLWAERPALQWE